MSMLERFFNRIADSIADGISKGIDKRISETKITIRTRDIKSIDELVNVVENTCFSDHRVANIWYNQCSGYSIELRNESNTRVIHRIENCRTMKILYEELLTEMVNGKGS